MLYEVWVWCIKGRVKKNDGEEVVRVAGHCAGFEGEINI